MSVCLFGGEGGDYTSHVRPKKATDTGQIHFIISLISGGRKQYGLIGLFVARGV